MKVQGWLRPGWRRLTRIRNDELEKFRLNLSTCAKRDGAPLNMVLTILGDSKNKSVLRIITRDMEYFILYEAFFKV